MGKVDCPVGRHRRRWLQKYCNNICGRNGVLRSELDLSSYGCFHVARCCEGRQITLRFHERDRPHKRLSASQEVGLLCGLDLANLISTYCKMTLNVILSRELKHRSLTPLFFFVTKCLHAAYHHDWVYIC